MKRITAHKGVQMVVVYDDAGIPIRTSPVVEQGVAVAYPGLLQPLIEKCRTFIKKLDNTNEFQTVRLHSTKNEILVYPEKNYTLVVVQSADAVK